jgi:hypothetical protein
MLLGKCNDPSNTPKHDYILLIYLILFIIHRHSNKGGGFLYEERVGRRIAHFDEIKATVRDVT